MTLYTEMHIISLGSITDYNCNKYEVERCYLALAYCTKAK